MKIMSLLRKPQSRGQERADRKDDTAKVDLTDVPHVIHDDGRVEVLADRPSIDIVPPEYRQGGERGEFGRGRNTPMSGVAQMMDSARAAGVQPKAQPGAAQGAKRRGGGIATPQRPPADGQGESAPTPAGVARLFQDGLSYRDISGRLGIPESAVRVLTEEHRESRRTLAEKIRGVGQAPRLFPWSEVRAAITTANNNGSGLVGSMATGQLGFLHDMASMMVLEYLGMDDVRNGEDKSYWGETLPMTGWTVEGGC